MVFPIASLLMPAMNAARSAQERLTRDLAEMQLIEALRMHAAETGKLPGSLDEVTIVPVPNNPATDKPFLYSLDGKTAVLKCPKCKEKITVGPAAQPAEEKPPEPEDASVQTCTNCYGFVA